MLIQTEIYETGQTVTRNSTPPCALEPNQRVQVESYRFVIISLFILLSCTNAFQCHQFATIEHTIISYYGVSPTMVSCTWMVYPVVYVSGIVPAIWALDRFGIKKCLVVSAFLNAFGSLVKCFSTNPNGFLIALLGQTISAVSQLFILNMPPLIASNWFPENEVNMATAFGVSANQVGIVLAFFIPTIMVPEYDGFDSTDLNDKTKMGLFSLFAIPTAENFVLFICILIFFEAKPEVPPSRAQLVRREELSVNQQTFGQSLVSLLCDINFGFNCFSYGLITGASYAISTVLGHMVEKHFGAGLTHDAGLMGLIITISGICSILFGGLFLDETKSLKNVCRFSYCFSVIIMFLFAGAFEHGQISILYSMSMGVGVILNFYFLVGIQFGVQTALPISEGTSAGLLIGSTHLFGIAFIYLCSWSIDVFGSKSTNIGIAIVLTVGLMMVACGKNVKKIRNVQRPSNDEIEMMVM